LWVWVCAWPCVGGFDYSGGWSRACSIPGREDALGAAGGPQAGAPTVEQLRSAIVSTTLRQRTMFGSVLNVARAVRDAVLACSSAPEAAQGTGGDKHPWGGKSTSTGGAVGGLRVGPTPSGSKGAGKARTPAPVSPSGLRLPPLVRVSSEWVALFRRAHRLFYLACSTGAASSGAGSGGADVLSTAPTRHYGPRASGRQDQVRVRASLGQSHTVSTTQAQHPRSWEHAPPCHGS
jgi:hypothetical protein